MTFQKNVRLTTFQLANTQAVVDGCKSQKMQNVFSFVGKRHDMCVILPNFGTTLALSMQIGTHMLHVVPDNACTLQTLFARGTAAQVHIHIIHIV